MGGRAKCSYCDGIFNTDAAEWYTHECPARKTLEDFESLKWDASDWFVAMLDDHDLYERILDGIGKVVTQFKTKYGRLPEARHNGRSNTKGNPQRTREPT